MIESTTINTSIVNLFDSINKSIALHFFFGQCRTIIKVQYSITVYLRIHWFQYKPFLGSLTKALTKMQTLL